MDGIAYVSECRQGQAKPVHFTLAVMSACAVLGVLTVGQFGAFSREVVAFKLLPER